MSWRSPPRLRRWRRWRPLEASTGLVPASAAKAASLRMRAGSPLETISCVAQIVPTPHSSSRCGAIAVTQSWSCRSSSAISRSNRRILRARRRMIACSMLAGASRRLARTSWSPLSACRRCGSAGESAAACSWLIVAVLVNPDSHRPTHRLTSNSQETTGLGQGCVGQGRTLLSSHRPVTDGGGRRVHR